MSKAHHTPLMPARAGLAEEVFVQKWSDLHESMPTLLSAIIDRSRVDLRSARVAASVISWIGTPAGAGFILSAKELASKGLHPFDAYLMAWAHENRRCSYANSNVRTIEVILSPGNLFEKKDPSPYERASQLNISMSDIDVVESIIAWLSTTHGGSFVDACVAEHKANQLLDKNTESPTEI
jgi:hypothetical protein